MKAPAIWMKLLIDGKRIVNSSEIRALAKSAGIDRAESIDYLQRHKYIARILRGIFYVRSADERERSFSERTTYELVAKALEMKGVKRWYFCLETALKLNGMTHEYFAVDSVATDSFRTTKVIDILGSKFRFHRWSADRLGFGVVRKEGFAYSDPEKTVLDLAYRAHRSGKGSPRAFIDEYAAHLDKEKLSKYLKRYPLRFQKALGHLP
ncbi:MAG: type IV toxin-antitoxin system AbiEi family antitoxin [Candidatus Thermoplasmatota archaeon]